MGKYGNPQEWPHLHVPFSLSRKKFKDLSTAEFVYGYLGILTAQPPPPNQSLKTSHLMTLMCLASKYDWAAVLSFHAAVLECIESGLANWGEDFSEIEGFNITESNRLQVHQATASAIIKSGMGNNNAPRSCNFAVSGIAPRPAAILPINKVRNKSVHILSCPITP